MPLSLLGSSSSTSSAICGSSAGATPIKETMYSLLPAISSVVLVEVPVLPPMR